VKSRLLQLAIDWLALLELSKNADELRQKSLSIHLV
jgi:hypothetical protein